MGSWKTEPDAKNNKNVILLWCNTVQSGNRTLHGPLVHKTTGKFTSCKQEERKLIFWENHFGNWISKGICAFTSKATHTRRLEKETEKSVPLKSTDCIMNPGLNLRYKIHVQNQ